VTIIPTSSSPIYLPDYLPEYERVSEDAASGNRDEKRSPNLSGSKIEEGNKFVKH
jgi:hypothetical protein